MESAADSRLAEAVLSLGALRGTELSVARDALTQDDLYTLLAFARRVTVHALRARTDLLGAAWIGLGIVDADRVDWRDAAVAVGLLGYGTHRAAVPVETLLGAAQAVAGPSMVDLLGRFGSERARIPGDIARSRAPAAPAWPTAGAIGSPRPGT